MEGTTHRSWSDQDWVEALRSAESPRRALAECELHKVLRDGLRSALASRLGASDWLNDFAQEAAMHVLQELSSFRGDSSFLTWALSIAVRVAFTEMRRKRWRDVSLDSLRESRNHAVHSYNEDPERAIARRKLLHTLQTAMSTHLTPKQFRALSTELKGMPQSEIGTRMGAGRNAIYKLTHDARRKLKQVLSEQGVTAESIAWAFSANAEELQ